MFALVQDVAKYPQFLPWCCASRMHPAAPHGKQAPALAPEQVIEARVDIAYLGVRSHFTTRNVQRFPESIELTLVDGPFRDLRGTWTFRALREDACKVTLELHYRFAAGLLGRAIAPVFDRVANSLVDAFARRAQDLYACDGSGAHGSE